MLKVSAPSRTRELRRVCHCLIAYSMILYNFCTFQRCMAWGDLCHKCV